MIEPVRPHADAGLATAFSMGPVMLTITRLADGRFVEVNERFLIVTGYSREEVLGRTPFDVGLWVNPSQRTEGLQRLRAGNPVREIEADFRMKDGTVRTCLMSGELIELHGEICALTALTDITERKQAEAALERYHLLSERTRDIILFIRPDGQIVEANAAAGAAYGYDRATMLTKHIRELHASLPDMQDPLEVLQGHVDSTLFTTFHQRGDGRLFPVEVSSTSAALGGEQLLLTIIRDITERTEGEAERADLLAREHAARVEAEAAVRVRDTFLTTAAHELRNPLTILLGNVQVLQRRLGDNLADRERRLLRLIGDQATRLNRLIAAMLDLSRISSEQLTITSTTFDLCALVRQATEDLQPTLTQHTLTYSLLETPLMVQADELRLEQVLQNLLSNAIKYSPEGGAIHVHAERRDGGIAVAVSDQGIGIPSADMPKLFQRYYRGENTVQAGGIGIGLAVVHAIVERHGGRVEVESTEGQGSTFTIWLPEAS